MENELISIIVPIYNVERYLDRCMDSILHQTYKNIEVIMVDDGSPDSCPQMCDEYALRDNRIKVIHKENAGLGFARNSGLEVANGQFVVFVDSDDYVTLDMCESLYRAAKEYDADVVYGGVIYENTQTLEKNESPSVSNTIVWEGERVKEFLLDMVACEPSSAKDTIMEVSVWKALFRKKLFDEYGIKFVSERQLISEDVIFDIDYLSRCKRIAAIPNCVYYYCVNPNSLSKSFRTDRFDKVLVLYNEIKSRLNAIGLYSEAEIQLRTDRFLIARARTNAKQICKHKAILGTMKTNEAVMRIIDCTEFRTILCRYPVEKLPIKYAIIAMLMRYKMLTILKIVFCFTY